MESNDNYRRLPNDGNNNCFGCGPTNPSGLHMEFYTDGKSLISSLTVPSHLNGWRNLVHGGVIATILDEIMGWSALHLLKKFGLTKSISVDFLKPVHVGQKLKAVGRTLELRGEREALMESCLYSDESTLCAKAVGTFGLFTAPALIKLGIIDEETVSTFEQFIEK